MGLVLTTLIWGATFVIVKEALHDAPPFAFGAYRFLSATIFMMIIVRKEILHLTRYEFLGACGCGFFLFTGYTFKNFGLWDNVFYLSTSPSKSAFITSISVLMVPLFISIAGLQKISVKFWFAVVLAMVGLYLLLDPSGTGMNRGDLLTFGCATSFAIHIILQDKYAKSEINISRFFFIQIVVVTILSFISSFAIETHQIVWTNRLILAILLTGIFATAIAILMMIWAQQYLSASKTAIIFSLEPVFAATFSWILISEVLGFWGWVGGILVVLAVVWGEVSSEE